MTVPARLTEAWWCGQASAVELCAAVGCLHRDGAAPRSVLLRAVTVVVRATAEAADAGAGRDAALRVLRELDRPGGFDPAAIRRAADEAIAEVAAFYASEEEPVGEAAPYAADAAHSLAHAALEPSDPQAARLAAYSALSCTFGRGPGTDAAVADAVRAELPWDAVRALLPPDASLASAPDEGHPLPE